MEVPFLCLTIPCPTPWYGLDKAKHGNGVYIRYSVLEVCNQERPVRREGDGTRFRLPLSIHRVTSWFWHGDPIRDVA